MRPGKRTALPNKPEGGLQDLIKTAKAYLHSKVEELIPVIKQPFRSQKTSLRDLSENQFTVNPARQSGLYLWIEAS